MNIFTKHDKSLIIILLFGLLSGIGMKYFRGGFENENIKLELTGIDEKIQGFYTQLNNETIQQNEFSDKYLIININSANKNDLIKLSGVGPALADRIISKWLEIVSKWSEIGGFNSVDELKSVKGIGKN